jgi:hypothetical protein
MDQHPASHHPCILTFQTYACYLNPKLIYPDFVFDANTSKMIYTLAGRNAVMMVISIIALVRQDARFYSFAFLMHSLRELQDMFIAPLTSGVLAIFFVFLFVFVIPEREWLKWWAKEVHHVSWVIWKTLFIKLPAIETINKKAQSALKRIRATRKATRSTSEASQIMTEFSIISFN